MANPKPKCNEQLGSVGKTSGDAGTAVVTPLGALGTLLGLFKMEDIAKFLGISVEAAAGGAGAALGAATVVLLAGFYLYQRCAPRDGVEACAAGVVVNIVPSFDSVTSNIFPFTAMHDRVDLVVKSEFWPLLTTGAVFVKCNDDPLASPLLECFYKSAAVCAAAVGGLIGSIILGAVGVYVGAATGAALAASLGCAALGPLAPFCFLLALIVAAIIAAVMALLGAVFGAGVGKVIGLEAAGTPTHDSKGHPIEVGQYARIQGNFVVLADEDGALCEWWAEGTALAGASQDGPPFSYTDPDAHFPDDGCGNGDFPREPPDGSEPEDGGNPPVPK
jgi:hypothetical protein